MSQKSYEMILANLEQCENCFLTTVDLVRQIIKAAINQSEIDHLALEAERSAAAAAPGPTPRLWTKGSLSGAVYESLRQKSPQLIGELLDHAEDIRPGTNREAGALLIQHLVKKGKLEQDDQGRFTVPAVVRT